MGKEELQQTDIFKRSLNYFVNDKIALNWFYSPNLSLSMQRPIDVIANEKNGSPRIAELIAKLQHGMTS